MGEVVDNHGGGSITVTKGNTIHVAYYPHGDDHVLYRQGQINQYEIIEWEKPITVGDHLTYPKIFLYDNKIYISARRTRYSIGKDPRPLMVIYEKISERKFSKPQILLTSSLDGYANFNFYINKNENNKNFYLTIKRVEGSINTAYMIKQSIEIYQFSNQPSIKSIFKDINSNTIKAVFKLEGGIKKNNSLEIGPGFIFEESFFIPIIEERKNHSELFLL